MTQMTALPAQNPVRARTRSVSWAWVGVLPFFVFAFAFMLAPSSSLFIDSFRDADGRFTLDNIFGLFSEPSIRQGYWLSIQISVVTALVGGLFGFLLAYSVTVGGLPRSLRSALVTISGVASNFAGVPLAFAFISALGRTGFITALLKNTFGLNIYDQGFTLYSFSGLSLAYLYFQFPLMVLIMIPALDGLRPEWREAAENLGGSSWQYWRYVALPILLPSILGTMILLFGNAFGAYATAYALTGGANLNLITIQIGAQMRGDVLFNPNLGYVMAFGMVLFTAISMVGYIWLQRRAERWLR